ncbi:DUF1642 domain-containing protein [Streptococcus equi]|uniref:DUF1642 domain-containing protein n=4 Tax=Streptococcus equi TaxID=1336 RepID=UPI000657B79F|nr:DUF1642 domain-containing protein [Streptococcus equi]HEL0662544.1 DUF1642 domain-containing protein [Streptococcus equi subsp. zooepidemicus]ASB96440.1 putative phage protein [Streptococcus equi subsp. equi]MBT1197229.1 DUF1642 domain-containing protein [Streptococcus equi subsp. equi]MBT1198748.1 DUF1642 domain-containing protein [Streptococcus equi subsp. equi]MBT1219538.1 DUF1642 domain-containing protein [Streptococcus equi subsp. equi]
MNIEEAIKYFEDKRKDYIVSPSVIHVSTVEVINILKQIKLDKPKPEIPQFVADYIDDMHKNARTLRYAFKYMESNIKMHKWCVFERQETFVNAFLYGYTIEKEKLYIVEIPNPNSGIEHKHIALARLANGKLGFSEIIDTDFYSREDVRLTESEIRKDFDWAWREGFAKEVTE